ncbi:MAG: putative sugar O-methyltransferase [Parvularculaceae bacterium]
MTTKAKIEARVRELRAGVAYENYLDVRAHVFAMMDAWETSSHDRPSAYWREEIDGFSYLFDASPLMVGRLREQCYHVTGLKSYEYRAHHAHKAARFEGKFKMLAALDPAGLFVPESPALGGFGFDFGEGLVNIDTLKFYEVMIGLEKSGALARIRDKKSSIVIEIGSGWGGFAYCFKTLFPEATFVCVDLPPTMLFSGVYLKTLFPDAAFLFYGEEGFETKARGLNAYDFVFLPHFHFPDFAPEAADLAVNMVSFQEMTTAQVEGYVRRLREFDCGAVYSLNRDRSKHNGELSNVREVISEHYAVKHIDLLDIPYTELKSPKDKRAAPGPFDYRHCIGEI